MNESGKKAVIKTWAKLMISPDFVGHTIAVHNGNKFIPVFRNRRYGESTNLESFHQLVRSVVTGNKKK